MMKLAKHLSLQYSLLLSFFPQGTDINQSNKFYLRDLMDTIRIPKRKERIYPRGFKWPQISSTD